MLLVYVWLYIDDGTIFIDDASVFQFLLVDVVWLRCDPLRRGTSSGRVLALGGRDFRRCCCFRSTIF